VFVTKTY